MWQFSDHFATTQPARVARLNAWRSYTEIVDAVLRSAKVDPGGLCWQPRNSTPTDAHRVECGFQVSAEAADALFNSPHGYRAMYARSVECGEEANRRIVEALVARLWADLKQLPTEHCLSLTSDLAKIWMLQDHRLVGAICGRNWRDSAVEIHYPRWIEQLDTSTETPRGPRWFARGGVLTSSEGQDTIELKGAWVLSGEVWIDPSKEVRSEQLHRYGFS